MRQNQNEGVWRSLRKIEVLYFASPNTAVMTALEKVIAEHEFKNYEK